MSESREEVNKVEIVKGALRLYTEVTNTLNAYVLKTRPMNAAEFSVLIKLMVDGFCSTASGGSSANAMMVQAIKDLLDSPPVPGLEIKPVKRMH